MPLSFTEENYIKLIYRASKANTTNIDQEVTTNEIADLTQTKPASVSDMLKKLAAKGLINYVKYQGVTLTPEGEAKALLVIRKHRLWEVFLVDKLQFSWDQVHDIAEQLEHIQSDELINRLDKFLEFPQYDPHGDPIPNDKGELTNKKQVYLIDMKIGDSGDVVGVKETSPLFLRYLDKIGVNIGAHIEIMDKIEFDQSLEIKVNKNRLIIISKDIAQNIYTLD
ncbi:metal-dependent transcriptional regulator [Rhodocytophaga rosea]|uniref:Transcriptional regulator MntR n=1 Tax=Rhodocytophaga rosea TaxID=2704465 RepID=A0A6C0GTR1_9BACT|nr:metal-dependent transcriptional regulator [Rhodocytophaga rosea]QHT71194.1 metal-dependent transcriptional regulator [Rhodocytophaga rosea]